MKIVASIQHHNSIDFGSNNFGAIDEQGEYEIGAYNVEVRCSARLGWRTRIIVP